MVSARRESGAAPFMGQDALLRLAKSQQSMLTAGGEAPASTAVSARLRWRRTVATMAAPGQCEPR
jgi:hypothetical protein